MSGFDKARACPIARWSAKLHVVRLAMICQ
jgi:hypothetical protein